jgi:urea transport system permease protein
VTDPVDSIISVALDFIASSLVLALVSFGLAVVFGLVRVINMAHGAMLALGAYLTWALRAEGLPFPLAFLAAAVGVGLIGLVFEILVIRHFYEQPFETLLITWGFYLVATEVIKLIWGSTLKNLRPPITGTFSIGDAGIGRYEAVVCLVSATLLVTAAFVLTRTDLGLRIRAMIQNREMALMMGVNAARMYRSVFVVGAALAGLAGGLIAPLFSIEPDMGTLWLVRSFFAVTVGGLQAIVGGTLLGSTIIGGGTVAFSLVSQQVFAQTVVFALAVLALRFRPTGILGRR